MAVSYDVTATLRAQDHGHPPVVLVFESHNIDCRYRPMGDVCETVTQYYGTGGCNQPIVLTRYEEAVQQDEAR